MSTKTPTQDPPIAKREFQPGEIEAAKEFFLKHGPDKLYLVVAEMRDAGWGKFELSEIGGSETRKMAGLVHALGWLDEWNCRNMTEAKPGDETDGAGENAEQAGVAEPVPSDLRSWLVAGRPDWNWKWKYQEHIYLELEKLTTGNEKRLMVFLPPRHGKSELITIRYAAWRLAMDPSLRILIGSYNQRLANRFSRSIRRILSGRMDSGTNARAGNSGSNYGSADVRSLKPARSIDEWETTEGGGVKAAGVGAGITGFGANLIIIDDPIKGRADAESENNRERVWEWFTDDVMTRLEPDGSVILIQTRWHDDDLAGRLQRQMAAGTSKWRVVSLPALAETDDPLGREPGEALCPERFDRAKLLRIKSEMGSYSFSALYQQSPVPSDGGLFKHEWFSRIVDRPPEKLRWCRGYDLAVSTKTSADYTASFRCALDRKTGDLYIADGFRRRIEFPEQRRYIIGRIREERNTEHGIEAALHGQAFVQELWREKGIGRSAFRGVRVSDDKFTRALAWANRAEAGKVVLVRGPWIEEFLDEVCRFPNGRHDDQIDAVSLAVQMIERRRKIAYGF